MKQISIFQLRLFLILTIIFISHKLLAYDQVDGTMSASVIIQPYDEAKLALVASKFGISAAPYQKSISKSLKSDVPILALDGLETPAAQEAQAILLADERIIKAVFAHITKQVVSINSIAETQPELSERLKDLSIAIAKVEPAVQLEVSRYLSFIGDDTKNATDVVPLMVDTKSAFKDTLCERSKHLCVGLKLVMQDRKLKWLTLSST